MPCFTSNRFSKFLIIISLIAMIIIILTLTHSFLNNNLEEFNNNFINKRKIIKIGGDNNFPPYEYINENGVYTGFNVDIIQAAAFAEGFEIDFIPMSWEKAINMLKNGEIDAIQGMKVTKERSKIFDFSNTCLENSQSVFTFRNREDINGLQDLSGKIVAIQKNDVAIKDLKSKLDTVIIYTENQEQAMEKLLNKEVDAYIGNTLTGVFLIDKFSAKNKIELVGDILNPTKYSIAVQKGDIQTISTINRGLDKIKRNGTYEKIYKKWFGRPIGYPMWYIRRLIYLSLVILTVITIILIVLFKWNSSLHREVSIQTDKIKKARDFRDIILNNVNNGIIILDTHGNITFYNDKAMQLVEADSKRYVGEFYKNTPIKELIPINSLKEGMWEVKVNFEGQSKYIESKVKTLNYKNDDFKKMGSFILIIRDITKEKALAKSMQTKDKLDSLNTMIAGIAHEIRNPLTSIKTYVELIPRRFENPSFRQLISKDVPREINRIHDLIQDLIEYSCPRKPFFEKINLKETIDRVTSMLKTNFDYKDIVVKNYIAPELYIVCDKNHFRQILINVILNAIESLNKEYKKITYLSKIDGEFAEILILDNGCGISEEKLKNIFDPFYTTKSRGTGLGLYVSHILARKNDGYIFIESQVEQRTTVKLKFRGGLNE